MLGGRPEPGWDVRVLAVRAHQLVVVAAPGLAAARGTGGRPGQAAGLVPWLARQAWLLREPGSGTRAATDALLTELDIAPLTLMVGSNGAIRESASVGLGVTLISRDGGRGRTGRRAARRAAGARHPDAPGLVPGRPARPGSLPAAAGACVAHVLAARRLPPAGPGSWCFCPARGAEPTPITRGARAPGGPTVKERVESRRETLNRQPMSRGAWWPGRTPPPTHRRNHDRSTGRGAKGRWNAGVIPYAQMGYWDPTTNPRRPTSSRVPHHAAGGVPPEEAAAAVAGDRAPRPGPWCGPTASPPTTLPGQGLPHRPGPGHPGPVLRLRRLRPRPVRGRLDREPHRLDHRQRLQLQAAQGRCAWRTCASRSPT